MRNFRLTARPAVWTLVVIIAATAANASWCLVERMLGLGFPFSTFLPDPADRFADFFKVAFSYPGARPFASGDLLGLRAHLLAHMLIGYDPRSPFVADGITHFHLTPLSTLLALGIGRAMRLIEPALLLLAASAALAAYAARVARLAAGNTGERWLWFAVLLASYPMLLVWDRGNLLAGFAGLLLLHALVLTLRGRSPMLVALLVAVAVNIRPNAGLFLLPVVLWSGPGAWRSLIVTALAAAALGLAALALAHLVYPPYTLASMGAGLARYYWLYVVGDGGLAYGSSLLGALKLLIGFHPGLPQLASLVAIAILAATLLVRRRLDRATELFLVAAAYALGSAVFADYHLLIFLAVPMAWSIERRPLDRVALGTSAGLALAASWLMVIPKNYAFAGPFSAQVLANPLVLLLASTAILVEAARATQAKGRPVAGPPSARLEAGSRRSPG